MSRADDREYFYRTKRIQFLGRNVDVCTQNENGPCPLLALANVLLLRNSIQIGRNAGGEPSASASSSPQLYSSHEVIATLATRILDSNVSEKTGEAYKGFRMGENARERMYENNEKNIETALSVLPSLVNGLDVNVQFIDSEAFEYTANLCVFDALDVSLYHGWVVDAKFDVATGHVISRLSYNQLVERLIALRELEREQEMIEEEKKKIEEELNLDAKENVLRTEDSPTTEELNKQLDELAEKMEGGSNVTTPRSTGARQSSSSNQNSFSENKGKSGDNRNSNSEKSLAGISETEEEAEDERVRLQKQISSNFDKVVMERTAIEEFLEATSTQCTEEGLKSVFSNMRNNELGVFFRNNHFSVIFKRDNQYLLSLVTDEGFIDEPSIVWEIVYDDGAIDDGDIDYAEETDDEQLARLMREQRAREREQVFLNADFKPFDGTDEDYFDLEKNPPAAVKTKGGRTSISSSQPGTATSGSGLSAFSPRHGTSFPASPAKALGGTPTATTISSDDDFEIARKLHSELNPGARFEAPAAPDAHHVHAQFVPPAQTYENSADADLAYAMRLQEEEERAAAAVAVAARERRPSGHFSEIPPTYGARGRLAEDPMYATDENASRRGEERRSAYLRPVRKMKVSSSSSSKRSASSGSGSKTSENCCIQ